MTAASSAGGPSALRLVLGSRFYSGALASMLLSGLGVSSALPMIGLFLVRDLHASIATAGLYYLSNLTAPIAGYLVGSLSDRTGRHLTVFRVCSVAGLLGWMLFALSTQAWMPFVVNAVILGFSAAAGSQLFAALGDELARTPSPSNDGVVAIVRVAYTAGWAIGPLGGSVLAAATSPRVMLAIAGLFALAQVLPLGLLRGPVVHRERGSSAVVADGGARPRGLRPLLPLLAFAGLWVLVCSGDAVKFGYLPLFMRDGLHLSAAVSGAVIGVQQVVELVLMPFSVLAARRIGMLRLLMLGAACAVAADVLFATAGTVWSVVAGQVLMGGVWASFAAVGLLVAQRLLPHAIATASAIFMSGNAVGFALGGLAGGIGVTVLGLPLVYLVPAAFALIAVAGLGVMSRVRPV